MRRLPKVIRTLQTGNAPVQQPTSKLSELLPKVHNNQKRISEHSFIESLFPNRSQIGITIEEPKVEESVVAHKSLNSLQLEENISTIYASMEIGDLLAAEKLFHKSWRLNNNGMKANLDSSFPNRFIELYLQKQLQSDCSPFGGDNLNELHALEWYHGMEKQYGWEPNTRTFALLISYFLESNQLDRAKNMILDMESRKLDYKDLFRSVELESSELQKSLTTLLQSMGRTLNNKVNLDQLLFSAIEDSVSHKIDGVNGTEELEELIPTDTKGVSILRDTLNGKMKFSKADKYNQQLWLEARAYSAAQEQFESIQEKIPEHNRKVTPLPPDIINQWYNALQKEIENELQKPSPDCVPLLPFLKLVSPDVVSRLTITEVLRAPSANTRRAKSARTEINEFGQFTAIDLAMNISAAVQREHNLQQLNSKQNLRMLNLQKNIHKIHSSGKLFNMALRKAITELARSENKAAKKWKPDWGSSISAQLGAFLLRLTIKIAYLPAHSVNSISKSNMESPIPALKHEIITIRDKKLGIVKIHNALYDLMANTTAHVAPWSLPMLVPPLPWLTHYSGGYLQHRFSLVRTNHNEEHDEYIKAADEAGHLTTMMRSLDILGSTAWIVNKSVYKVAAQLWNTKEAYPGLPSAIDPPEIEKPPDMEENPEKARAYRIECRKRQQIIANNFSDRANTNYKLDIARAFLDEKIYFPHNVDFRGRAYPLPPHLHHMGDDLCRGLLLFYDKKKLGTRGLYWLKVHISNLFGNDKAPMDERALFTEEKLDEVLDSARNPIDGNRWWLKGSSPWQLLASCMELEKALQLDDPTEYECNLHIHQDGSCNGLQHYAALGGDIKGAKAVNLVPAERPGDVYSEVAEGVQKRIDEFAAKGVAEAILLKERINRKFVKQTVMTNTYGVTRIGARDQIQARLKEARVFEDAGSMLTDEQIRNCANFATNLVFDSMKDMFEGARDIQIWLNNVARLITQSVPRKRIDPQQWNLYQACLEFGLYGNELKKSETTLLDAATNDISNEEEEEDNNNDILDEKEIIKLKKAPLKITSVTWTTPLGFPIVQPYRKSGTFSVKTFMQNFTLQSQKKTNPVNSQKQSSAFPPNFVHSLDASHMMLTCLSCASRDIQFAAVHDSYWTHANDIDELNTILRDAFIKLHSKKVMQRLFDEFMARYSNNLVQIKIELKDKEGYKKVCDKLGMKYNKNKRFLDIWVPFTLPDLPATGSFDVNQVRNSTYFFQ